MSVTPNNIVVYGSANMPEADGAMVGGAVDFTKRVAFYDISPNGQLSAVSSSSSDIATKLQVAGRDASGVIQTPPAITLTGTTPVASIGSSQIFERIGAAVITGGSIAVLSNPTGTPAVGDVALYASTQVIAGHTAQTGAANTSGTTPPLFKLQSGDGASVSPGMIIRILNNTPAGVQYQLRMIVATSGYGTDVVAVNRDWVTIPTNATSYDILQGMLFEISPNPVTAITRCFWTLAADVPGGSARYFYEKVFVVNTNASTALTGAQIEVALEAPTLPSVALLDIGLCTSLNDTNAANPRQQSSGFLPTGLSSFIAQPAFINVPGAGNLPPGNNAAGAQGVWLRLSLPAGTAAYKGSADIRTQGTTI